MRDCLDPSNAVDSGLRCLPALALAFLLGVSPPPALAAASSGPRPAGAIGRPTAAQTPVRPAPGQGPQGRTIEEIRVVGNVRLDADTIRFFLASRPGAPFDWDTARQDYLALYNTGWFRNLVMRWEEGTAGGVVLVVELEEKPLLREVRIEGTNKLKPDELFERMELLDRPIVLNEAIDEKLLNDAIDVLQAMLQTDKGLQFVQIDLEIQKNADGATADAVYHVIEGDEVRVAQVVFEGATVFSQKELRWALKHTGEHHFLSFLGKGDRFSMAAFEADMFEIGNMYRRKGYIEFDYGKPRVEIFNDARELWWGDKLRLAVTVPLYEGPQYRVGDVRVTGNTAFPDEELLKELDLEPGDILNVEQVQAAREAIQAKYAGAGYLQVSVAPFPVQTEEPTVMDLEYRVAENAVYRVNRIEFEGNTVTRDFVLRRNMNLQELARWDQDLFKTSVERLFQLGYFEDVDPQMKTAAPGEQLDSEVPPDPQYGSVDLNVKVQEVGRNQITFGGGLSALEGGFLQLGYTTRNLFGRGQTVSIFAQVGAQRQNIRLSYADPYFLGRKLRFGVDVFRDALDFPDFQRKGTGFSIRFGRPLNLRESLSVFAEYNYEEIDIGDVSFGLGGIASPIFQSLFLQQGRRVTSSVRPFLFWANVDNPFLPARGTRTTLSFEYAGGPLGGSLDFWKALARTTWWIPLKSSGSGLLRQPKQILAVNLRLDWAQPHNGLDTLPIFERFFLGGSNSVRGTRLRSIGPIDERGNILGGTKAFQYNIEYIFALSKSLRVKVFHDAGQAWSEDESINLLDMRRTAGLEFEVFAPVFNVPFRFFWANNFDPLEIFGEQRSTFEFAIGSTF